jgi:AraC-like DNA-binding protein/mannose-6-phosphate isomerase-like protein (cupin superfamily)
MYRVSAKALPIRPLARDYPAGWSVARHRHRRGQLVYAASGVMRVTTRAGIWIVPPQRAVWVPPRMPHQIEMEGAVAMRTLYLDRRASAALGDQCKVLVVSGLVRELVLGLMDKPPRGRNERGDLMTRLLLRELSLADQVPLHLPTPTDPRLQRACTLLLEGRARGRTLDRLARSSGASTRTLARLFRRELKTTFVRWRQHADLARALNLLAAGASVKAAARSVGYDSASAFTAMFRRALGVTPTRYVKRGTGLELPRHPRLEV